jgi:hypothetical protein
MRRLPASIRSLTTPGASSRPPNAPAEKSGWRGASIRELARLHYEAELRQDDADRFRETFKTSQVSNRIRGTPMNVIFEKSSPGL